jgi:hypothetical protein
MLFRQVLMTLTSNLATWVVVIRRINIQGQPGQKHLQDPISMGKKLGMAALACYPIYTWKPKIRRSWSRLTWAKSESLSPPNYQSKKWVEVCLRWKIPA